MQPELTDRQQLYLISTIFTSRGQLDTPLQPLDPRRIQYTPIFDKCDKYVNQDNVRNHKSQISVACDVSLFKQAVET